MDGAVGTGPAACGKKSNPLPAPAALVSIPPSPAYKPGDRDNAGNLIFWTISAGDHDAPFVLTDDYGTPLINPGGEDHPEARYVLACRSTGKILATRDFGEFTTALVKLPPGTSVRRYETCSVPRSYGLSQGLIQRFEEAFPAAGLRINPEISSVCYCPDKN